MGIFKWLENVMGAYKYPVPIIKMRAGNNPVWMFDNAKRIKGRGGMVEYVLYRTDGRFPPPRANEVFINNKGRDVFPKIQFEDGTFVPLTFELGEEQEYFICKGCGDEIDSRDDIVHHLSNCGKTKEMLDGQKKTA